MNNKKAEGFSRVADDIERLKLLGAKKTDYPTEPSKDILETFDNTFPDVDYYVDFLCPEYTSKCPRTGQPDFAVIKICYIPDKKCIESKSLKLYLFSYRNHGAFHETVTNQILKDFVDVCQPKWCGIEAKFNTRGGIAIDVNVEHCREDYIPPHAVM